MMKKQIRVNFEHQLIVRCLGIQDYLTIWQSMQQFTQCRQANTVDEIWLLEHYPVFTQGQAGNNIHLMRVGQDIPVIQTNRGGQVTYHGPGQLIAYTLVDLSRKQMSIRSFITFLTQSLVDLLRTYGIFSYTDLKMPGVYACLNGKAAVALLPGKTEQSMGSNPKIASIGLRVHRGCTYHGIALNVNMDLRPFTRIAPCGFPGLKMTQLSALGIRCNLSDVGHHLIQHLCVYLQYQSVDYHGQLP